MWYRFLPDVNGTLTLSTPTSSFDTTIEVYRGHGAATDANRVVCDATGPGEDPNTVAVVVKKRENILIRVGGHGAAPDTTTLQVTFAP